MSDKQNRGARSPWTNERKLYAASIYATGVSLGAVAEAVKSSKRRVKDALRSIGVEIRGQSIAQSGSNNPSWKGGMRLTGGYWMRYSPEHPFRTTQNVVAEHRLVMEKSLGRYLKPTEVVHHKDGNTLNNDIANLELFTSNAAHLRATLAGRCPKWTPEGKKRLLKAARAGGIAMMRKYKRTSAGIVLR